jgi:hypothetical protein
MKQLKQLASLLITIPLAFIALLVIIVSGTVTITVMAVALYTWVICNGMKTVYKMILKSN